MVSRNPTVLKPGEDFCVSFLDMSVKSEEHESFAAIVTDASVTGGNLCQRDEALGPGKEYCFELRD